MLDASSFTIDGAVSGGDGGNGGNGSTSSPYSGGNGGAGARGIGVEDNAQTVALIVNGTVTGGDGSVSKTGAGTLFLTGANTYSGATYVTAGTLQVEGGGSLQSASGYIAMARARPPPPLSPVPHRPGRERAKSAWSRTATVR